MKKNLLLFLLLVFSTSLFSQGKEGVIKVRKRQSQIPTISGLAGGEIDASLLCVGEGIVVNKKIKVVSFVLIIEHGTYETSIKHNGNVLTKESCDIIALLQKGNEVYINEIAVVDNEGRQSLTTPMRFKIK